MAVVRDVIAAVLAAYPVALAEDWDTGIGLTCGDPDAPVDSVLLAVDADEATVDEAIRIGAAMLVTHHPLLFRGVQSVAADSGKGALIHRMIRAGVAHFAAHTNADSALGGVNDALAASLELGDLRPLVPTSGGALYGGALMGGALRHGSVSVSADTGSGRVGLLPAAMSLREFTGYVAQRLPATVAGVRAAGDPQRLVRTVAVCGGAGDSFLPAAADAGADVYVTSDLRHHVVAEFVADPGHPAVVDIAHWAGESPWLAWAAAVITADLPELAVAVSQICTDPWTVHAASLAG